VHDELLFPYPDPLEIRDPQEAQTVTRLIARLRELRGDLIDSARFDEEETIGDDVVAALAESGFLGLTIPPAYGGLGLSATGYARVFEAISDADASTAVLVGVHCGLGSKAIVLYGTDAQKERYLPALARGDMLAAYALTEPEIGSDAQHIRSRARLSSDGSEWIIDGHKLWIGNAHRLSRKHRCSDVARPSSVRPHSSSGRTCPASRWPARFESLAFADRRRPSSCMTICACPPITCSAASAGDSA